MSSKFKEQPTKNAQCNTKENEAHEKAQAHEWIDRQHKQVFNADWSEVEDDAHLLKEVDCPGMGTLLMPQGFWDMIEEQEQLLAQGLLECHSRTQDMKARVFRGLSMKDKTRAWTFNEELRLKKEK